MKAAVITFPGSNCDRDLEISLAALGYEVVRLWHKDKDLQGAELVCLPGGFSYGDYLRSGAIARFSPIMDSVVAHARRGGLVLGICNGFQILTECHLLPGALLRNTGMLFVCSNVYIRCDNAETPFTRGLDVGQVLRIPIAHADGRYYAPANILEELEQNGQVVFRYCSPTGQLGDDFNPNGSLNHIAGICNRERNVLGMMPHPERAWADYLGNTDGSLILKAPLMAALHALKA
ncbi:MAG: phosphoribosylformylglycinamidine synthase subunit PurQ [Flavobacteriales bacterium]|nr:phosphoribosylformylglycinamidine synthase subunit PurQ [Flavobacteriales bacterium]MCX7769302.1 phosphoribosylformylglycinamidine synthase subunit PurQ [Flavobacteriales bacterium]MDW8410492.1 phosphoribosylformylglycinamidine synthase subunit PurQ [Flavobacteriales bacterium]